jgi:hypothetical protein
MTGQFVRHHVKAFSLTLFRFVAVVTCFVILILSLEPWANQHGTTAPDIIKKIAVPLKQLFPLVILFQAWRVSRNPKPKTLERMIRWTLRLNMPNISNWVKEKPHLASATLVILMFCTMISVMYPLRMLQIIMRETPYAPLVNTIVGIIAITLLLSRGHRRSLERMENKKIKKQKKLLQD